jgi:hypothetical protein
MNRNDVFDKPDALPGHDRSRGYVSINNRSAQGTRPKMLDFKLSGNLIEFTFFKSCNDIALPRKERFGALISQAAHRNNRKTGVKLGR